MDRNKAIKILKELELLRDRSLCIWSPNDLVEKFFLTNLNIFTSTFFFAVTEIVENVANLEEIYSAYFRSRNTPTRYLIEQYLTMIHVAALAPEKRKASAYRYELSGKLNIHKLDLQNFEMATTFKLKELINQTSEKLNINRRGYRILLELDGKLSDAMPDEIDGFFEGVKLVQNIHQRFGVDLYLHGKIKFMDEVKNNTLISDLSRQFLLLFYPLLSMDIHPTHNSIVDFEQFIKKSELQKKDTALGRHGATAAQLCTVGADMVRVSRNLLGTYKK